ncbi:ABC transporter ATP-binding protein [Dongia sp.]|uniref:ABC transporter ATP-binding protein n=1 Tax=Dongia sp. TaxID=1977262 RepID=UPI0035B4AB06
MSTALQADNVSVSFAGLRALSNVALALPPGRITGLIGPNGAGKTTLVNVLTGFQSPTAGRVLMNGDDITGRSAHIIRRLGVARTFQSGRLFNDLPVVDNLEVTAIGLGMKRRDAALRAGAMLEWMGIEHLAERTAGALPYTDERRVAIARALMMEPRYLLLDEPAAGMSHDEATDLAAMIRRIAAEIACGVLLIEHNIGLVLEICDMIHVLDSGEIIETGDPAFIRASEKVRHAYMGTQGDVAQSVEEAIL